MTTQSSERIPELTLGWRLKMALGDMKRDDMAEILGVNPATISRWMADKGAAPKRAYLSQWAFATGTSLAWLETGNPGNGGPTNPTSAPREPKKPSGDLASLTARKRARAHGNTPGGNTRRYSAAA